jgi:capsid protein
VTPALPLFAMARRYTLATVLAAETAADFAVLLQTQANAFDQDAATPQNPFESVDIDRGMMTALPYGYEMAQMKAEQPTTTYTEFRNALLQEIARCIHMPTNKARGDSSGYNYSSGRLDHQIYYHALECERVDWETECLDRILGWWMQEARLVTPELFRGLEQYEDIREVVASMPHRWTWRPATSINPREDATAAVTLIDAGLMSERQYLLEHGMDPESHWTDIMEETPQRAARMQMLAGSQAPAPAPETVEPVDPAPAEPEPEAAVTT